MPLRLYVGEGDRTAVVEVGGGSVTFADTGRTVGVSREADGRFVVRLGDGRMRHGSVALSGDTAWVFVDGRTFQIRVRAGGARTVDPDAGALSPPMPATVVRIAVRPGQPVERGDLLVALEAMKMELPIRATRRGVVGAVHCREGELVQPGTRLLEIE